MRDFLPNIIIHNTLSICDKMADRGPRDLIQGLKLYRLVSSCMILIRRASLGHCIIRTQAYVGARLIE